MALHWGFVYHWVTHSQLIDFFMRLFKTSVPLNACMLIDNAYALCHVEARLKRIVNFPSLESSARPNPINEPKSIVFIRLSLLNANSKTDVCSLCAAVGTRMQQPVWRVSSQCFGDKCGPLLRWDMRYDRWDWTINQLCQKWLDWR